MANAERKDLKSPDETRTFEKGKAEIVNIGGGVVGKLTLEPGWRWSQHVKPIAGTEWCEAPHFQYHASGRIHIVMADGTEFEVGPGEVRPCPPAMTPGSSATSQSCSSTGRAPATTRRDRPGGPNGPRDRPEDLPPAEARGPGRSASPTGRGAGRLGAQAGVDEYRART